MELEAERRSVGTPGKDLNAYHGGPNLDRGSETMSVDAGTKLGRYKIRTKLGAGDAAET